MMKLYGLTPVVSSNSSASGIRRSITLLRQGYGGYTQCRIHPQAHACGFLRRRIKAVIFDKDGLIINSEPIQSKAFAEVIKSFGKKPIPYPNGLIQIVGLRGDQNWRILKRNIRRVAF